MLGPLTADDDRGPIDLKGPRHHAVLARLLVAKGHVVSGTALVDALWDEPRDGALGAVQTFVGALRKALEPDRAPRSPSRLLVTAAPGYALHVEPSAVDAGQFEAAAEAATGQLTAGRSEAALVTFDGALRLWRGPAYEEFAEQRWARAEIVRLTELQLLAAERRAEAALAVGRAAETVAALQAHVTAHPLRENGWRLLALALYRTRRQGDALAALRRARTVLRSELGVDPGVDLRRLEADILDQAPQLDVPQQAPIRLGSTSLSLVGRADESRVLDTEAADAVRAGRPRLVLVSGAAGAGKTALVTALTDRLTGAGWLATWGACPELAGAPAAWPWTRMREQLARAGHAVATDGETRFERHRVAGAALAEIARTAPVLLIFDDVHWADEETLALLTDLAADHDAGPLLLVATYRSTDLSPALTQALGRAARTGPTRIYLGGLSEPAVIELVDATTAGRAPADAARIIHKRSDGNPFFVTELARLWDADGDAALQAVPAGVRDVIRQRLAALDDTARTLLRQAAVLGVDIDLELLVALGGLNDDAVLDSVETAVRAGHLVEPDSGGLRFAHALVQETVYGGISRVRRAAWHAEVADIVERTRPADVATIAHHLVNAGDRARADRTARYARVAAERAEQRSAPRRAAHLWRGVLTALDRPGADDPITRLDATMGLVRAMAVTGDMAAAREQRGHAISAATALGDPQQAARAIAAFTVPGSWTTNDDDALSARIVQVAERALAADGLPEVDRGRLLATIAMERRADSGGRGEQAARDAEAIARRRADPVLLAAALNGRFLQTFHRAGLAAQRGRIGAELVDLAHRHPGLVTYEVLGHLIQLQSGAAAADLDAADRHAAAAEHLAQRHDLPGVEVLTAWYAALRLAMTGHPEQARSAYRTAAVRLAGAGMPGMEQGLLPLALLCLDPRTPPADADWGPYEPWARPYLHLARGRRDAAAAAARAIPDSPRDLLLEARTCLHAGLALEFDDRPTIERLHHELLPAAGEIAGAGSGVLTLGPVAALLERLSDALLE